MRTETTTISPQKAKLMLAKSGGNRTMSKATVAAYARDMRAGRWVLTHQGLLLGRGDAVIDGHHRLHAVVVSGTPQAFLVTRDESIDSPRDLPLDVGFKRSLAYVLGDSATAVSVARLACQYLSGKSLPTPYEVKWYLDRVSPQIDLLGTKAAKRGISTAPVILAAVARILRGEEIEYISSTYYGLVNDKFQELSPFAASFYKQMVVDRTALTPDEIFVRALRTFDCQKRSLSKLQIKNNDGRPFRETAAYAEALDFLRAAFAQ